MKPIFLKKYVLGLMCAGGLLIAASCSKDDPLSNLTGITTFGFTNDVAKDYNFTVDNSTFVIKNTDSLPYKFDVTKLVAKFTFILGSKVSINNVPQVSGVTVNDFTNEIALKVVAEDGVTIKNYRVLVNVAKTNPEGVKWRKTNPNAFDSTFETQEHFFLNGKHFVVLGEQFQWFVTDPASKLYSTTDGVTWKQETINPATFPVGFGHNIVVKDNKAYCVGYASGVDTFGALAPTLEKNLYTSTDGITWTKTANVLDQSRVFSPAFVLGGSIYAFGGNTVSFGSFDGSKAIGATFYPANGIIGTTLASANGTTFTPTAYASIPARTYAASYVYNNKMYIAGGLSATGAVLNDVWSSTDGVAWTQVSTGGFTARMKASCVVYDNKIWMIGGALANGSCATGILVSSDGGVTWAAAPAFQALPNTFTPRCNADVFVDATGNLWIIGGESTALDAGDVIFTPLTDVWIGKLNKI